MLKFGALNAAQQLARDFFDKQVDLYVEMCEMDRKCTARCSSIKSNWIDDFLLDAVRSLQSDHFKTFTDYPKCTILAKIAIFVYLFRRRLSATQKLSVMKRLSFAAANLTQGASDEKKKEVRLDINVFVDVLMISDEDWAENVSLAPPMLAHCCMDEFLAAQAITSYDHYAISSVFACDSPKENSDQLQPHEYIVEPFVEEEWTRNAYLSPLVYQIPVTMQTLFNSFLTLTVCSAERNTFFTPTGRFSELPFSIVPQKRNNDGENGGENRDEEKIKLRATLNILGANPKIDLLVSFSAPSRTSPPRTLAGLLRCMPDYTACIGDYSVYVTDTKNDQFLFFARTSSSSSSSSSASPTDTSFATSSSSSPSASSASSSASSASSSSASSSSSSSSSSKRTDLQNYGKNRALQRAQQLYRILFRLFRRKLIIDQILSYVLLHEYPYSWLLLYDCAPCVFREIVCFGCNDLHWPLMFPLSRCGRLPSTTFTVSLSPAPFPPLPLVEHSASRSGHNDQQQNDISCSVNCQRFRVHATCFGSSTPFQSDCEYPEEVFLENHRKPIRRCGELHLEQARKNVLETRYLIDDLAQPASCLIIYVDSRLPIPESFMLESPSTIPHHQFLAQVPSAREILLHSNALGHWFVLSLRPRSSSSNALLCQVQHNHAINPLLDFHRFDDIIMSIVWPEWPECHDSFSAPSVDRLIRVYVREQNVVRYISPTYGGRLFA